MMKDAGSRKCSTLSATDQNRHRVSWLIDAAIIITTKGLINSSLVGEESRRLLAEHPSPGTNSDFLESRPHHTLVSASSRLVSVPKWSRGASYAELYWRQSIFWAHRSVTQIPESSAVIGPDFVFKVWPAWFQRNGIRAYATKPMMKIWSTSCPVWEANGDIRIFLRLWFEAPSSTLLHISPLLGQVTWTIWSQWMDSKLFCT